MQDGCFAVFPQLGLKPRTEFNATAVDFDGQTYFYDRVGADLEYIDDYNNAIRNGQIMGGCGWTVDITNVWTGPVDYQAYHSFTNGVWLDGWSVNNSRDGVQGVPIPW